MHYRGRFNVSAVFLLVACSIFLFAGSAHSKTKSKDRLEYGTVLFEYYQQDYFNALIEHEYNASQKNPITASGEGQVLKGGMMLSYGVPDRAYSLFQLSETLLQ